MQPMSWGRRVVAAICAALLAEHGLTLRNSWENQDIIVVGLDHDATLEELRQLKADLEAEPGVVYVEFDGIAHIMGEQ